uniref:Uncharacterized protein n=1 Tax=Rhizophora mucronata TaxID=61149 RepID=A0A2P2PUU2_RHIMU
MFHCIRSLFNLPLLSTISWKVWLPCFM